MRAVVQRVLSAAVAIEGVQVASIGQGLLTLVGIHREDSPADLEWMAQKILELRIFDDSDGRLNLSLLDIQGELLLVSQFTLFGDCRKGRRPSYSDAASPPQAEKLYKQFLEVVRQRLPGVQSGRFQATMDVTLTNSGPVTLLLDSRRSF